MSPGSVALYLMIVGFVVAAAFVVVTRLLERDPDRAARPNGR